MGGHYVHHCNQCECSFETTGPWEFYRTDDGSIHPYGHPGAMSHEAEERGIYGADADVYCPVCDRVFSVILIEYKEPYRCLDGRWSGSGEALEEYEAGDLPVCPSCGGKRLILDDKYEEQLKCPRCATGQLVGNMDWIS